MSSSMASSTLALRESSLASSSSSWAGDSSSNMPVILLANAWVEKHIVGQRAVKEAYKITQAYQLF